MTNTLEYSTNLTGAAFLLYELKIVLKLKKMGLSDQEIRRKVINENLFETKGITSLQRTLPTVIKRANVLDEQLKDLVLNEPFNVGKLINLYAIMKTDKLFFEFINEVIREKLEDNYYLLEKKELNVFFVTKLEQDEKMAKWAEVTINKLKQVYMKILFDAGLLKDKESGELNRLLIDEEIKRHLVSIGDVVYLRAMGQ